MTWNGKPQPEHCGHCGESAEAQNHCYFCFSCGKFSMLDGTPVTGNHHARANISTTFPEANAHGMTEYGWDWRTGKQIRSDV